MSKLNFSIEIFRNIFNDMPYGFFVLNSNNKFLLVNKKLCNMTGYPEAELMNMRLTDIVENVRMNKKDGDEYKFNKRSGETRTCKILPGKVEKDIITGYMEDITEIKILQEKTAVILKRMEITQKKGGIGSWEYDFDTERIYLSKEAVEIIGGKYTAKGQKAEIATKNIVDKELVCKAFNDLVNRKKPFDLVYEIVSGDEFGKKTIYSFAYLMKNSDGKPVRVIGYVKDITMFKKRENEIAQNELRLKTAEDIANIGNWVRDLKTGKYICSDGFFKICGYKPGEFFPTFDNLMSLTHKDDVEAVINIINSSIENGKDYMVENRIVRSDGEIRYVKSTGRLIKDKEGIPIISVGTMADITDLKIKEIYLLESEKRLKKAESITHIGNWERNFITDKVYWSDEMYRIFGYEPGSFDVTANKIEEFLITDDAELLKIEYRWMMKGKEYFEMEVRGVVKKEETRNLKIRGNLEIKDGKPYKIIGTLEDITELKKHLEDMKYIGYHDILTGLYNRRFLDEEYKRLDVPRNYPLSVIMADINGLKLTNDTFGYEEGDKVLIKTAELIKNACKADDIIARTGGGEFILLLPGTTHSQAEIVINRILESITNNETAIIPFSISVGFAVKIKAEETKKAIFKKAEDNLYRNKIYDSSSRRRDTIKIIMNTLYEKSSREELHSERVSEYCRKMGVTLKMKKDKINELTTLGLLHDIGKITVRDIVLNKSGKLSDKEWEEIKGHSETGYRILSNSPDLGTAAEAVLAHHERWDGTGYPKGIAKYDIPLFARIISIADAFDAMISERPYRLPLSYEEAVEEMRNGAGTQFDSDLVKVFVIDILKEEW